MVQFQPDIFIIILYLRYKKYSRKTNQVALAEWVMPFCQYSLSSIQYFSQLTTIYLLEAQKKLLGSKNFLYSYGIEINHLEWNESEKNKR